MSIAVSASRSSSEGTDEEPTNTWYQEDGSSGETLLQLFRERQPESNNQGPGAVYLVGTGPGDPGLLTLKAVRLMQTAHVVLYDRLVSEDILRLINPSALMVYVGKQRSYHTRTQSEIHELLRTFAADAGATVVRLKGGDPFVFGRGGEEAEYLQQRGVSVHCVPGITAAAGISAELGIPLTHRGLATSVRFLTGHARDGGQAALDEAIATAVDPHTTLVVYMGLATLRRLISELTQGGIDGATPAAAIERGTTPEQRIVWSTLEQLADEADAATLQSPTLIIIGKVVALALGWQQAQATGNSLQVPGGAHHLPLPVFPGIIPVPEDLAENPSGWRML
jgi:uroporphyrin-III C-methyltransferase